MPKLVVRGMLGFIIPCETLTLTLQLHCLLLKSMGLRKCWGWDPLTRTTQPLLLQDCPGPNLSLKLFVCSQRPSLIGLGITMRWCSDMEGGGRVPLSLRGWGEGRRLTDNPLFIHDTLQDYRHWGTKRDTPEILSWPPVSISTGNY